ncbi:MAG: hypothetical protein JKY70_15495 [Mucilaginibacter sp.]|nr:hypothetical protein [Mucilaginibacter sp.]
MNKHYGKLINQIIRDNGHSIISVAKHLSVDKEVVKQWLNQPNVELDTITKIGRVIVHDFKADFPELYFEDSVEICAETGIDDFDHIEIKQPEPQLITAKTGDPSWKDKYIRLMEEYNNRLTEKLERGSLKS